MKNNFLKKLKQGQLKFLILAGLFFSFLLLTTAPNSQAQTTETPDSKDAIAVRIVENPNHYSSARWYQLQNFQGSPQTLQVDGYEAIRNGRTVYVNAANVVDSNNDGTPDAFYTNIFIISYTESQRADTPDIFGQLLKNFKFNTNFFELGACSQTSDKSCLTNKDCPADEYCNSQKSKVVRDVKRLADLTEMQTALNAYKQKTGVYPSQIAGTYLAGKTLSTWSSWQESFAKDLGIVLPVDPINKLGTCDGYDPNTCWDASNKTFATNISQAILPSGSHVYAYLGDSRGANAKYCAQMESGYANLQSYNCFTDKRENSQPIIKDTALFGWPKKEFNGYVSVFDADGDPLKLSIALSSPAPNVWIQEKWGGFASSTITALPSKGQMKIYVPITGNAKAPGYYKVRLTLDDQQGAANSIFSQIYDLTVQPLTSSLSKTSKTVTIGQTDMASISGTDSNGDPIQNVYFESATYNSSPISQTVFTNSGFSIAGATLQESFRSAQKTGVYVVNVSANDSVAAGGKIFSNFTYTIVNKPPVFKSLVATFINNTTKTCAPGETCYVSIDNGEAATVRITGEDPDGHALSYSLVDNFGGKLSINSTSGVISGLQNLGYQELQDQVFNIEVKISDAYCANSSPAECSSNYSFSLKVMKYCSVNLPGSTLYKELQQTVTVANSGDNLNTGLFLSDCSEIGTSSMDVKFVGEAHSQAIILVSDLSKSMDANITIAGVSQPAVTRLKSALTKTTTGFLDSVYGIASTWPSQYFIKVGLIAYNTGVVSSQPLTNLVTSGNLSSLKNIINNYTTYYQTDTLSALNAAETALAGVTDPNTEKIVILMSDGIPGIDGYTIKNPYCYEPSEPTCYCGGTAPDNCNPWPSCDYTKEYVSYSQDSCSCVCACGGTSPNCTARATCPAGQEQGGCTADDCYTPTPPPHSSFNPFQKIKRFFAKLLNIKPAQAITTQNECAYKSCEAAFPDFSCPSNQYMSCSYYWTLNCDLTPDVDKQANIIKSKGISLYTIYYDTSNTSTPKQKMCNWSSNNGVNCDNNTYAFAGSDIDTMIKKVLGRIVTKPKDVTVGNSLILDQDSASTTSFVSGAQVGGLSCGAITPKVTFSNNGYLEFSNIKLNYCPAKLHP
ncbi:MAG: VWA domain-containing protein [Candidatus Falkowbacteria bacterium]|nr:MAG: VWA domain-containing protein [Candidatus Falkowbacteria bacterium]